MINSSQENSMLAKDCALSLLDRSISFGHRRLAVIRFFTAVQVGAAVTKEQAEYCRMAASMIHDLAMQKLFIVASEKALAYPGSLAEIRPIK